MPDKPSPVSNPTDAAIDSFIRQARENKEKTAPAFNHPTLEPGQRVRWTAVSGVIVGLTSSLVFAFVSQVLNILFLPGLPLFQSVLDPFLNTLVIIVFGTIFSLVSVASLKIQNRSITAILILLVLFVFYRLYQLYGNVIHAVADSVAFWFLFLIPVILIILLLAPFGMLLRWTANSQVRYFYLPITNWRRALPPATLLIVTMLVGMLFVFSTPEQKAILTMNALIRDAQTAHSEQALPDLLQNIWGPPFYPHAKGSYYIIAQHNPITERYNPQGKLYTMDIYISAQFQSGYWFTCRFTPAGLPLQCFSDYEPPYPNGNAKNKDDFLPAG